MNTILKLTLMSAVLAGSAAADLIERDVSRIKLLAEARVMGDTVKLADVLDFSQAEAQLKTELGVQSIATGDQPASEFEITHDQIERRLDELGVNAARVLLCGAWSCRVSVQAVEPPIVEQSPESGAPLFRAHSNEAGSTTLADALRAHVANELESLGGEIDLEFERAGREFIELTTPPFDFDIRGGRGSKLGLREFRVTLRRDGRTQRTVTIGVSVSLTKPVIVAAKPLNAGTYVQRDSLELATRVFTADEDLGIEHVEQAVGQRVAEFIPAGRMVRAGDLTSVDLVKRSQPVTVVGGESVSIRVTGDALDSGGFGDSVRVRLGNTRRNQRVVRGVVTGVATVQLTEAGL